MFEIAVVIALFIRIVVDVQSKSLDLQIQTLEDIMMQMEPQEQKFRALQTKTKSYATIWTTGQIYSEIFKIIGEYIPVSAVKYDVNLKGKGITITGQALSADIQTMENALKASNLFTDVTLDTVQISNEDDEESDSYMGDEFTFSCKLMDLTYRTMYDSTSNTVNNLNVE